MTGVTWPTRTNLAPATAPESTPDKGFLAIIQYAGGQAARSVSELGGNWYQTAVLFAFKKDDQGQWTVVQDEHCLDPMNQIETLAEAKKAFAVCSARDH